MISLIFTACLLSGDHSCHHMTVPLDKKETILSCLDKAQMKAKDWQAKHTKYVVVGWHCSDKAAAPKPSGLPDGLQQSPKSSD
jgi:hypothetical protein